MSRDTDTYETIPALSVNAGDVIVTSCQEGFNRIGEVTYNDTFEDFGGHRFIEILDGEFLILPLNYPVQKVI